jgi:diacylglycerol kinase
MKKFLKGFSFAFSGIWYTLRTQGNMKFHLIATFVAIGIGFAFNIQKLEWFFVGLSITLVLAAELFNTAIERLTDLVTKEIHPLAKVAKDAAAGAVLIFSIFALITGIAVFGKYIIALF